MNDRPNTSEPTPQNWNPLKIAGLYLLLGGLWILFSDKLALMLSPNPAVLSQISILKGWAYIGVTALLLYWLIRRHSTGLSQSEARYRSLFQNNHSVMLLIDPTSGHIVDANPSACAFYGYTHSEITDLEITAINQLNREQVFVEMERARQEERCHFFSRHRLARGDIREVEVYSGPIEVQGQALLYSIVHDITERKQAEAELNLSLERLSLALEAAQAGTWEWDLKTNENIWSEELWRVYGLEPHSCEPSYETWQQTIHPEDRAGAAQAVQAAAAKGLELNTEWRVLNPDGTERWLMSRGKPARDTRGQVVRFNGIVLDITERKQAEADLAESEDRLNFALEVSQIGAWEFDLADHSAYRSLQHARIFGYEPPLPDWTLEMFLGHIIPEERAEVGRQISQAIATRSNWSIECRIRRCDGEIRWIWVTSRYRNELAGNPRKMVSGIVLDITERKRAEQSLQESERRYRELVQNANSAIIRWKRNGDIAFFNEFAQSFFGYRPEQIIGQKVNILVPATESTGGDLSMLVENIVAHPEQFINYVNENVCRDGRRVWMAWTNKPIYENGRVEEILAVGMDITERKRAEEKLRDSEEWLRLAYDAAELGIWRNDIAANIYSFDARAREHYGLDVAEIAAAGVISHIHPDDLARLQQEIVATLDPAGSGRYATEYRVVHPDGVVHWLAVQARVVFEGEGEARRPVWGYGTSQDITARKQVEAQIKAQARRLQTLADTSHAFAEVGTDYQTVLQLIAHLIADHLNAGCVIRLLSEDGQWLEAVIVYDQDPAALAVTETIIRNNTRYHIIKDALNPAVQAVLTGQHLLLPAIDPEQMRPFYSPELWPVLAPYCPRSALIAPLMVQKHALGVLSFSRYRPGQPSFNEDDLHLVQDLADRAALALSNARLFGQVQDELAERKRAEEELRQTAAELARSNADLEQFAYAASHDLQEPLRAVAGTVQLLQKRYGGQLDERADEFIRHAVEGATRMQTLINDLLVFSRVGTRGQPFQPMDSAGVLADALANLTVAIRESGAVITSDNLPPVVADRTQLIQLFQNLIANAIKFRGERVPQIQIRAEQQAGEWVFAVADNGIGLEAENFERIFGVFQRLHTRREYPGTGIGLALCKKIVERHGGRIWVESEPGQGSTFYFTLSERRTVIISSQQPEV